MEKKSNPTSDYYKLLLYVVFLVEFVLFTLAVIFGRTVGYKRMFIACFLLGAIVAGCFLFVILLNLMMISGNKMFKILMKGRR